MFPDTKEQRCWWHKLGNVLAALPKSAHPGAKAALAAVDDPALVEGHTPAHRVGAVPGAHVEPPEVAGADELPVADHASREADVTMRAPVVEDDGVAVRRQDNTHPHGAAVIPGGFARQRAVRDEVVHPADRSPGAAQGCQPRASETRFAAWTTEGARCLTERLDVAYADMVFIDDQQHNVVAAQALGIPSVWCDIANPQATFDQARDLMRLKEVTANG